MTPEMWRKFCSDYDVQVAVLSRNRAESLLDKTDHLARDYVLFHCGDGYDEREYHCAERVAVPPELLGRPTVANYAVRTLTSNIVILLDDDIYEVYWNGSVKSVKLDSGGFLDMLCNLVVNALDVGAGLFGITENDVRKTSPLEPFHMRAMVTCLVGMIGPRLWHDERQRLKADYDLCLQAIKRDRLVWKDCRYFLWQNRNTLAGGNMAFRSAEREEQEVQNLRQWWGDDVILWKPEQRSGVGTGKRKHTTKSLKIIVP